MYYIYTYSSICSLMIVFNQALTLPRRAELESRTVNTEERPGPGIFRFEFSMHSKLKNLSKRSSEAVQTTASEQLLEHIAWIVAVPKSCSWKDGRPIHRSNRPLMTRRRVNVNKSSVFHRFQAHFDGLRGLFWILPPMPFLVAKPLSPRMTG